MGYVSSCCTAWPLQTTYFQRSDADLNPTPPKPHRVLKRFPAIICCRCLQRAGQATPVMIEVCELLAWECRSGKLQANSPPMIWHNSVWCIQQLHVLWVWALLHVCCLFTNMLQQQPVNWRVCADLPHAHRPPGSSLCGSLYVLQSLPSWLNLCANIL